MNRNMASDRDDCAMLGCREPAAPLPLVVNVASMPGPFQVPLCSLCREPFEAGMEAVQRLAEGDVEALPIGAGSRRGNAMEAER